MHWVRRGPEPEGLKPVQSRYTPKWVDFYRHCIGSRPSDTRWRDFHAELMGVFFGICAYCEETCKGEVDHFRPKGKFPELVYEWSNLLFSCHDCNHSKGDKWPRGGYVDPCAKSQPARPENSFTFDNETGEIRPKDVLSEIRRRKANQMIEDLGFNDQFHLEKRIEWVQLLSRLLSLDAHATHQVITEAIRRYSARNTQLSSISRTFLEERSYRMD